MLRKGARCAGAPAGGSGGGLGFATTADCGASPTLGRSPLSHPPRGDGCPFPQSTGRCGGRTSAPGGRPCDSLLGPEGRDPRHVRPKGPRVPSAQPPGSMRPLFCLCQGPLAPFLCGRGVRGPGHLGASTALPDPVQESAAPRLVPRTPPPRGFCSLGAGGVGVAGWPRRVDGPAIRRGWGSEAGRRLNKELETRGPPTPERLTATLGSVHLMSTTGTGPQGDRPLPHR